MVQLELLRVGNTFGTCVFCLFGSMFLIRGGRKPVYSPRRSPVAQSSGGSTAQVLDQISSLGRAALPLQWANVSLRVASS